MAKEYEMGEPASAIRAEDRAWEIIGILQTSVTPLEFKRMVTVIDTWRMQDISSDKKGPQGIGRPINLSET